MKTSLRLLLIAVASTACGPQSLVTDGTYQSNGTAQLPNASLVVDVQAKTASVTLSGSTSPVVLELTAVAAANWERGCSTNLTSVAIETWRLPEPTVLGSLSLTGARLVAGCGLDKGDPNTVVLKGTGDPNATQYELAFTR